jgi:hypothetical protein
MIPSLLQIPSAVSDSKLHSVLPNNGKGDFTFDRSTGATRINKDGLIEEVGYFSSELVQNGNFSELGSELVTNGDFADNSWWQLSSSNVNISNGKGNFTAGTTEYFYKTNTLTVGKTYKIVFEITDYTTGYITAFGGSFGAAAVGVGTYIRYYTAVDTTFGLVGNTFVGSIDNVSVKQVDPNDRWTLASNWSYGTNKVTSDGSQTGNVSLTQANSIMGTVTGRTYQVKFTISDYTAGGINAHIQGQGSTNLSGNGEKKVIITASSASYGINMYANSDFAGSLSNISVVEVQGDRPRLSYDITNGVVEDKPHLLLENSSTNLVTFSEDYTQSVWAKENITVTSNAVISPDGTQNASILTDTSTNGQHRITTSALFSADGNNRVYSIFVKKGTSRYCAINHVAGFTSSVNTVIFDFDTASYVATGTTAYIDEVFTPKHYGNGWYKIAFRSDINSSAYNRLSIGLSNGTSYTDASYAGTGATVFVWGGQVEQQAYCTSYIPTAGTTITRAAETCNNSKPSVNSTEGVLYCEIQALANDLTYRAIYINDNDATRYIGLRFSNNSNQLQAICYDGANLGFIATTLSDITNTHKIALQYQSSGISLYVNGSLIGSDATFTGIAADQLDEVLFDSNSGTQGFYGKCKGLAVYNEALSESQLMQLTGVTASSIYSNFVTRTASFTVEALNEVKKVIDNL